ncbi:hypothetical protein BD310DRAFT_947128 [Dichomitus squalens]|uniref:F-box domain-containing protein n=1 Tax=Dichomitus squalens TaxID=114155 RepID=A0A4Q9Q0E8_9APHY|nr:hypothetical protein BD310DRAFT_947128 [Dichomitus squalens]
MSDDSEAGGFLAYTSPLVRNVLNASQPIDFRDNMGMLLAQDMAAVEEPMGDRPSQTFNSLSPMNTLPPELLGLILTFLYWRAVAIRTPDLWASFAVFHPDLAQECLVRSKTFPLSLSIEYAVSPHVTPILGHSAHRLRSVYVRQKTNIIELIWRQQLFTRPAPCLEELFVEDSDRHFRLDGPPLLEDATSPLLVMFSGVIPRLRILVLRGVPMTFTSPRHPDPP